MEYNRGKIINALETKGANNPCNRCGHKTFALIDGFTRFHIKEILN